MLKGGTPMRERNLKPAIMLSDGVFAIALMALITLAPTGTRLLIEAGPRGDGMLIYSGLFVAIGVASALIGVYAAFVGWLVDPSMPIAYRLTVLLIKLMALALCAGLGLIHRRSASGARRG